MNNFDLTEQLKQSLKGATITRLFAEENIVVEYDNTCDTAVINTDLKKIRYPFLMCMSDDDIHQTLIFSEVAKILFPRQTIDCINNLISLRNFLKKYPLAEKTMLMGYKKLFDRGFFGEKKLLVLARFSTRFNFYKLCGPVTAGFISFDENEQQFMKNFDEESYSPEELLSQMHKLDSHFHQTIKRRINAAILDDEDEYSEFYAFSFEDDTKTLLEDSLITETYAIGTDFLETRLKNDSVQKYSIVSHTPCQKISENEVVKVFEENVYVPEHCKKETREFRHSCKRIVDSMVKVFESKKAAHRQKYAKISETGLLNINRVVNYRFSNDIFLNQTTLADAKNHGFVILLDCSGSIRGMYQDMAEQVIVLVEFFRAIGVKYKVYGFGGRFKEKINSICNDFQTSTYSNKAPKNFFEILNSDMNKEVHSNSCTIMHHQINISLGYTPTNTTVSAMEHIANDFFAKNQVQVKKLIIVTDGNPTDSALRHSNVVVVDPKTRKMYKKENFDYSTVDIQGALLKDRYDIEMISIALVPRFGNPVNFTGVHSDEIHKVKIRNDGHVKFTSPLGNTVYIARSVSIDTDFDDMNVDNDMSIAKATTAFTKTLKHINKSKNFLNILANSLSV